MKYRQIFSPFLRCGRGIFVVALRMIKTTNGGFRKCCVISLCTITYCNSKLTVLWERLSDIGNEKTVYFEELETHQNSITVSKDVQKVLCRTVLILVWVNLGLTLPQSLLERLDIGVICNSEFCTMLINKVKRQSLSSLSNVFTASHLGMGR